MSDVPPPLSFLFYPELLPELHELVGQHYDPLMKARLAMTSRVEDRRRRAWYLSRMSGERSRWSYTKAITRYGPDHEARALFNYTISSTDRRLLVREALRHQRDAVVLDWLADDTHTAIMILNDPFVFNSRQAALTAVRWLNAQWPWSETAVNEYWDVKEGLMEPTELKPWLIPWAIEHEKRELLLAYRTRESLIVSQLPPSISPEFLKFLIDADYAHPHNIGRSPWLPHARVAARYLRRPGDIPILWRSDTLERDACVAKEQGYDIVVRWRMALDDLFYSDAPARDWIVVMEYHGLRWPRATLLRAIDDGDYAAVVWHLKRPERCASAHLQVDMCAQGTRLLDDLLANGWLERDPMGQIAFSALSIRPPHLEEQ